MKPVLFARADEFETFGIAPAAVTDAGAEVRIWDAIGGETPPALDDVAGSSCSAPRSTSSMPTSSRSSSALRAVTLDALNQGTPYLGICFGAQILAWALGVGIERAPVREVGYVPIRPTPACADDPILAQIADGTMAFQWHMDTFALPDEATLLITGDDVAHQAYRLGEATWATQFHFEIDRPEIELWVGEVADTVEAEWGKTPDAIRAEADRHQAAHELVGTEVFRRFVKVAQERA